MSVHICEPEIPAAPAVGQLLVVDSELVQDRGPQVVDSRNVNCGLVAELIGRAVRGSSLDTSTSQPDAEPEWVMIAPARSL